MTTIEARVIEPDEVGTDVVPVRGGLVLPAAPVREIKQAQDAYHELCEALLDANDRQSIGEKAFVKKSGWRKLAVAYNVSCEILEEAFTYDEFGSVNGHIARAKYRVRATAPNGRHMDGIGLCDARERCCDPATCKLRTTWEDSGRPTGHDHCEPDCDGRHAFSKPDHDVPATAHTRATNRACADLFGLGEVSAEEVSGEPFRADRPLSQQTRQVTSSGPSDGQRRFMDKLIDDQGLSSEDVLKGAAQVAGRAVGDVSELTIAEASRLIDLWKTS